MAGLNNYLESIFVFRTINKVDKERTRNIIEESVGEIINNVRSKNSIA